MSFLSPYFFLLIPIGVFLFLNFNKRNYIKVASVKKFSENKFSFKYMLPRYFLILAYFFTIITIMRPVSKKSTEIKGVDIMISLDISRSMLSIDMSPNRLSVAKDIILDFILERENDNIGFSVFAGTAFTKVPPTQDRKAFDFFLQNISVDDISEQGTSITSGILSSLSKLKNSKAKSKIIVLVTDGEETNFKFSYKDVIKEAQKNNVKIYTIGIGGEHTLFPVGKDFFGNVQYAKNKNNIDENLLEKIANESNGKYFRAKNRRILKEVFKEIDKLEKSDIKSINIEYKEYFRYTLILSIIFLFLSIFFEEIVWKRIP